MGKLFLGIDPGSKWGWAFTKDGKQHTYGSGRMIGLKDFETQIAVLSKDVAGIITCRAMGPHAQVTRYHAAMAGVVELYCEKNDIPYFDIADSTMRKVVIGKGNAKKPEVMDFLKIDNEHAADAMVAALYIAKLHTE